MHSLRTQISFEAAHRLYGVPTYSEECRENLHGHSYKILVECSCSNLNEAGMVVDFKYLKKVLKDTIEDKYDHSCILRECDPIKDVIVANCRKVHVVEGNPTAEWMAEHFASEITEAFKLYHLDGVDVERIEVQETENNIAIWTPYAKLQVVPESLTNVSLGSEVIPL